MDEFATNGSDQSTGNIDHPANIVVLKEFGKIVNSVSDEEFLKHLPTTKSRSVKWLLMFKYLKERIFEGIEQEWRDMWKDEQLEEKLDELEKQTEKCTQMGLVEDAWRPITGDITHQLRIHDAIELQKEKTLLSEQLTQCEERIATIKSSLTLKRGYVKAVQLDLQHYQRILSEVDDNISNDIEKHEKLITLIKPKKVLLNE